MRPAGFWRYVPEVVIVAGVLGMAVCVRARRALGRRA